MRPLPGGPEVAALGALQGAWYAVLTDGAGDISGGRVLTDLALKP